MRTARCLLAAVLLAGAGPCQETGQQGDTRTDTVADRRPTVVVVRDPLAPESERIAVAHLLRALEQAVDRGEVAPVQELGRRIIDFRIAVDEQRGARKMSPLPESVRDQALAADVVVCAGFDALLPFLEGAPLPVDSRVYSYAARNLSHLSASNQQLPNRERLRGGVALDASLTEVVEAAVRVLARPSPMGVILSRRLPEHLVTPALRKARELEVELKVQWVDDGRGVTKAARALVSQGIRAMVFVPDPQGTDSRVGFLARTEIRLLCLRNGIAMMGGFPDDPSGHFSVEAEPAGLAHRMVEMIVEDWDSGTADQPPGIEPAPEVLVLGNPAAALRDGISLVK